MNALTPAHVELSEPEVEGVVLGSIFVYPEVMQVLGSSFDPDWFADPAARAFAEAIQGLQRKGHRITGPTVIAAVSPAMDVDGMSRAQFIAHCMTLAVPLAMLSGSLAVLKDRWARRILAREAQQLARDAVAIDVDPQDAATDMLAALDVVTASHGEQVAGSLAESSRDFLERISLPDDDSPLVTTGLRSLDEALNGYMPGKVYVIAARPGMGKSAYMCSSGRRTAKAGFGVVAFSLEMERDEIAARCISDAIASPRSPGFGALMRKQFADEDMEAIGLAHEAFAALPFHIDASAKLTMPEIASRCRTRKAKFEAKGKRLAVVFIDHMGLVEPSNRYAGNKVAETGEVSRAAKILAKQLGVCVVLLCQLSREVEKRDDKRPGLADLRWSGDIEQDADVCAFLYREAYYLQNDPKADPDQLADAKNRLDFLIRKNRNGPATDIPLWCSIAHSALRDDGRAAA